MILLDMLKGREDGEDFFGPVPFNHAGHAGMTGNCTICHAITPIVKAQKDKKGWVAFMQTHKTRTPDVPDDVYQNMTTFLQGHYNPQNPVPKLPPELDALGVPPA